MEKLPPDEPDSETPSSASAPYDPALAPFDPAKYRVTWRQQLLAIYPWIVYVLPLGVFMAVGTLEPKPQGVAGESGWNLPYSAYPLIYTLKIALTTAAIAFVWPGYRKFTRRVTPWSVLVGVVGVVVWVGLWKLQLDERLLGPLGLDKWLGLGIRSGYNPLVELADRPALAYGFMAVRLFGLVVVIAVAEEFFLRGFLMRFVMRQDWLNVPFGQVSPLAVAIGTAVPMMMHPAELGAAAVWFSLVTWLMVRTRSIWDCIVAHATTNLLLGIYVLWSGDWALM